MDDPYTTLIIWRTRRSFRIRFTDYGFEQFKKCGGSANFFGCKLSKDFYYISVARIKIISYENPTKETPKKRAEKKLDDRTRKLLNKYSKVGEIKKKLYSMPEYVRNRDRTGVKLPETKHKSLSQHMNLNISEVRGWL